MNNYPCEWVKKIWTGDDDDSFAKLIDGSIVTVVIPDDVTSIMSGVFSGCTSLTSITIPDSVTNIGKSAFAGCTNLKTINCGFAEGAVSDAPWGATNATINYNVTE